MTMTDERAKERKAISDPPDLLTRRSAARVLRWHDATVRCHIRSGLIPNTAMVHLPHRGRRMISHIKRAWLSCVLAGKGKE